MPKQYQLKLSASYHQPLGPGGVWVPDFYDDFDGAANAAPDASKWNFLYVNTIPPGLPDPGGSMFRSENTYLDGSSNLVVRVTNANIGHGSELSGGGLESVRGNFGTERYFECSASIHGWFDFWTQTFDGMWGFNTPPDPSDGAEFDIVEQYGGDANPIQHNVHWGGYGPNHHTTGNNISVADKTAFNTYGMWVSAAGGFTKFYVNGVLDWTFTGIVPTRTDNLIRLTNGSMGDITSAVAKVAYCASWAAA